MRSSKNKTRIGIFALLLVISIFSTDLVSADFAGEFANVIQSTEGWIAFFLGDVSIPGLDPGAVFFVKLLVFILLLAVIGTAVRKIPQLGDSTAVTIIVTLAVSLIAIRYITTESLINFIWLPYGVLGVALSAFLPFIIGFYFIQGFDSGIIRKVGWSAYLVIFLGLAYIRWGDFALAKTNPWYQNLAVMYLVIAILSLLLILYDHKVRGWMSLSAISKIEDQEKRHQAIDITREIKELRDKLKDADPAASKSIRQMIKSKKHARKALLHS